MKRSCLFLLIIPLVSRLNGVLLAQQDTLPSSTFGTFTPLSGYYDYQSDGRPCQYIRANPISGYIHAIYLVADDSNDVLSSRTAYAYSQWGYLWDDCNEIRLPDRASGFPALELGQGPVARSPFVANDNNVNTGTQLSVFSDSVEGSCGFAELILPAGEFRSPEIATASDGSVVVVASSSTDSTIHFTRTIDYAHWTPWQQIPGVIGSLYVAQASAFGRVGILVNNKDGSVHWYESTDNGVTWPLSTTEILPSNIVIGTDTFTVWLGGDVVYNGDTPTVAVPVTRKGPMGLTHRDAGIGFWSPSSGFVLAVPHARIIGVVDTLNKPQRNHLTVGYPSIGVSESNLVIVFQAFSEDTSAAGFNYSDVFWTFSSNGGISWSQPLKITFTSFIDERYPSVSKWNNSGQPFIVWQDDPVPGSHVVDGAPLSRSSLFFFWFIDIGIGNGENQGFPARYELSQNYPNPFNPTTIIRYALPHSGRVLLRVFNVLGEEVATLVDEEQEVGSHQVQFNGTGLASGVYFYRLRAGEFVETRKLLLLK